MLSFFEFQLKADGISGVIVLGYYIFLSKDTSFLRNRLWLLSSFVLPWCIPILDMPVFIKSLLFGSSQVIQGIPIVNDNYNATTIIKADNSFVSFETFVLSVYIVVSSFLFVRLFWGYISIINFKKKSELKSYKGFRLRIINDDIDVPFSFFRTIYVSKSFQYRKDINMILDHEATHCKHWHSIDISLVEWFLIIQWWNPFAWWLKRLITQNHEYCVDSNMLKQVSQPRDYQYSLIDFVSVKSHLQLVNNFNQSFTKKRIVMMNKKRNNKYINRLKLVAVIPIVVLILSAFTNLNSEQYDTNKNSGLNKYSEVSTGIIPSNNDDTTALNIPLYIVDGVEVGHMLNLNPDDIKSIHVIKPPNSVELYGRKGKDGVILVTSKKSEMEFSAADSIVVVKMGMKLYGKPKIKIENSALVYVDGVKKSTKYLNSLNQDKIESIEILKEEFAIKSYGDEGKNGVVLVALKKSGVEFEDVENEVVGKGEEKKQRVPAIKIKGSYSKTMPLIYVDGVKKSLEYMESIKPETISSVEVLKDNSAIESYGKEGENGVILVTLKK